MMDAHCIRDIYSLLITHVLPIFPIPTQSGPYNSVGQRALSGDDACYL